MPDTLQDTRSRCDNTLHPGISLICGKEPHKDDVHWDADSDRYWTTADVDTDQQLTPVQTKCETCRHVYVILVHAEDWRRYMDGEGYVQSLFPYLSAAVRELLVTRTCGPCFDRYFPPEGED